MKLKRLLRRTVLTAGAMLAVSLPNAGLGAALPIDPRTTVSATMDYGIGKENNTWYEVGVNSAAPTTGLQTGLVSSEADASSSYIIQPAAGLNVRMLDTNHPSGTLTFESPVAVSALSLAAASGNGAGTVGLTLRFTDGSTTFVGPVKVGDWFNNSPIIETVKGRIDVAANSYNNVNANNPRLLAVNTNLPAADTTNMISSIGLDWSGGANTHTMIFAVSGDTNGMGHFIPIPLTPDTFNEDIIVGAKEVMQNTYQQQNLVSDLSGVAPNTDTNLVNPWGLAEGPATPFWVADNRTGVSTVYDSTGAVQSLVVTIPSPAGSQYSSRPTGIVYNGGTNFVVSVGTSNAPAHYIFCTMEGTIDGWAGGDTASQVVDNSTAGAVYKGLAIGSARQGTNSPSEFLYAANFRAATVDVFDSSFKPVTSGFPLMTNGAPFTDTNVPSDFAPFNIANIGGELYVTYAMPDTNGYVAVPGPGAGYLDVFDTSGKLLKRLAANGPLNAPWGMAIAPASFGPFSGQLLVGNFGDGRINAFDASLGTFLGPLLGANEAPIANPGLWALLVGNGGKGGDTNTLYFTAGIPGTNSIGDHGLFGAISFPSEVMAEPWELGQTISGCYQDTFPTLASVGGKFVNAARSTNWVAVGPGGDLYEQTNNVLQVATSLGDPNHLIYMGPGASNNVEEILARVRMLAFGTNDPPRGGVAVGVNTNILINSSYTNWSGDNIQFRNYLQDGVPGRQFKFLDDLRAWGPAGLTNIAGQTVPGWTNGTWYWLRLRLDPKADGTNDLFGKVWVADGQTPEPAHWLMRWSDSSMKKPLHSGWAGITGCSSKGLSQFDVDYVLIKSAGAPTNTVSFDVAGAPPVPPVIYNIALSTNDDAVVSWFGGTLQSSAALTETGPWTDIVTNTPYAAPIGTNDQSYFRARQ